MKKILFLLLFFISLTVSAETYYVKNGGSDVAAGTSHETAWATVAKVNATAFNPGDSVLFRCNDVWREYVSFSPPAGTAAGRVYYGSYQTGNKPLFLGSKEENLETDWTDSGSNIWKNTDTQFNVGYGVGNLIFNNETSTGYKEADSTDMDSQGDWFWNDVTKQVYLYSTINPALYYTDIECALDRAIISLAARDYITLDGLDVRYGGQIGISGSGGNDNITVRNCHVSYIGGSEFPDATARYGNGIQFWKGATNIIIEKNVVEQIYDDGITPQYDGADDTYTVSMEIRYNVINYTRNSINIFQRSTNSTVGINIYNNTMMNAGLEWSSDGQRPDPAFGARHIRLAGIEGAISYFNIKNNIFYEADMTCFYGYGSTPLASFDIDNNLYFNSIGTIAQIEDTPYTTLAAWQTGSSQEASSVAGNPLFLSSTNFYLQATSPARNTGTDVSLTSDIAGITVPQETYPEIGAYEYLNIPVPVTGLGWEDHLAKRNFKDDVNFAGRLMIDGIPVTATASELNALVGEGEIISGADTLHLSKRIDAKADTSLSNLSSVAINTHLLPGTDGAVNLGSATYKFGNIFIDSAKVINWNNGDITETHSDQTLTFAGGSLVIPDITGPTNITELSVGNSASATKVSLDSLGLVDSKIAHYIGADTTDVYITAGGRQELTDVAILITDTLHLSTNKFLYTQWQVDSIMAAAGGIDAGDVAAQINDTIVARLAVAIPGVKVADTATMLSPYALLSEVSGGGIQASDTANMLAPYLHVHDTATMLSTYINHNDTSAMLAPYFTEPEIRKADSDTIPIFVFGAGSGGAESDTALFTATNIYGAFYNDKDTIIATSLRAVLIAGTTPLGTDTLAIQVFWNDTINAVFAPTARLNTNYLPVTSTTLGTEDTSFNTSIIPPGVWVFCKSTAGTTGRKPKALYVTLYGFKRNRTY